jgi:hypothetical protein
MEDSLERWLDIFHRSGGFSVVSKLDHASRSCKAQEIQICGMWSDVLMIIFCFYGNRQ